nr:hypothetical protein [Tanacetum cinerariifolium]
MAQMLQAPIEGYEDAIIVPPINANNFELKQTLINLVQSNQFTGRQDPHNHLRFFKKVTSRQCPHHGFSELHQLDTFYNVLNPNDQDALDSAAGGNFLDKIPQDGLAIIESKSKEPEATKDTELPSTENIQPPSVQVHEKDKEAVDKPFDVPKTKTNLPYPSRLLSINLNCQHLDKEKQEVKNVSSISLKNTSQISPVHAVAPILSTKEPEYSTSMGYEHANTTPETESDEIIKFGVGELVQILSENEVTSEDKRECDMIFCENYLICDDHSEISFNSKNDHDEQSLTLKCDDTPSISYNNFELLNKVDLIDATCEEYSQEVLGFSDVVASGNPTPYYDLIVLNSSSTLTSFDESDFLLHEEVDTFIAINDEPISPKIDATYYDPEGDILYFEILLKEDPFQLPPMDLKIVEESKEKYFVNEPPEVELKEFSDELAHINPEITEADFDFEKEIREIDAVEELHVDNSISNSENELSDNEASDFDNPLFPRPPPEPPNAEFDFKLDTGEEILVVMNTIDELECLDPRDEFDNNDCFYFMFVI